MTSDRQGTGFALVRIALGIFFIFEGLGKLQWFTDSSILAGRFERWLQAPATGSVSHAYLEYLAIPGTAIFSRIVPLGELVCGTALVLGIWTPVFALLAFFMALNFHIASGAIFEYGFLTNGYGLPVLGPTLGLGIGGVRLPWSVRWSRNPW